MPYQIQCLMHLCLCIPGRERKGRLSSFPKDTERSIKGDAVDLVTGLGESTTGEWSGDIDLDNGQLQQLFKEYQRLNMIRSIGLRDRRDMGIISVHR